MSASTEPRIPIGADEGESDADAALFATQFRALRCLHSSIEHLLHSPLNSIGLNLEVLAAEIGDLAKRSEDGDGAKGDDLERYAALSSVQKALRAGYTRLVASTETIYEVILPRPERIEEIDLARLARRVAGLGETEAVLVRAAWHSAIPPVPITVRTRRDLLVPALLSVVSSALEHAGAGARIAFSLTAGPEVAEIEVVVEPGRQPEPASKSGDSRQGLAPLVRRLGGACNVSADERAFRIHLTLPRLFGAAAC